MAGEGVVAAIREIARGVVGELRNRILSRAAELRGLHPDLVQGDLISLMGRVGTSTLTNPETYQVPPDYDFVATAVIGCIEQPEDVTENFTRLEFNIRNVGRSRDVFGQAVNMGFLLNGEGDGRILKLGDGDIYKFPAGSQIKLTWTRRDNAGSWIGGDKDVGVLLLGTNIKVR